MVPRESLRRATNRKSSSDPRVAEVESAVRGQIGSSVMRVSEQACGLTHVGEHVLEALGDTPRHVEARDLLKRSHQLRGLVLHGMSVLAQLQSEVGRLEALAGIMGRLEEP